MNRCAIVSLYYNNQFLKIVQVCDCLETALIFCKEQGWLQNKNNKMVFESTVVWLGQPMRYRVEEFDILCGEKSMSIDGSEFMSFVNEHLKLETE